EALHLLSGTDREPETAIDDGLSGHRADEDSFAAKSVNHMRELFADEDQEIVSAICKIANAALFELFESERFGSRHFVDVARGMLVFAAHRRDAGADGERVDIVRSRHARDAIDQ